MTEQCDQSSVNRPGTIREIRYETTRDATNTRYSAYRVHSRFGAHAR